MLIKADLHVHTNCSSDSLITLDELVFYSKKAGLNAVAVTDHNRIDCSLQLAERQDFLVIPGLEISSSDGHLVALNVKQLIPRGLSAKETIKRIHEAGGIAVACHPYAWFKDSLGSHVFDGFDAVETVNANSFPFRSCSSKAAKVAQQLNLPCVGGTDAHYGPAIGCGYTVIEAEPTLSSIIKAILGKKCRANGQAVSFKLNLEHTIQRLQSLSK